MSFWHIRSRRFEGIQWLERLLDADSTGQPIQLRPPARRLARGVALLSAGNLNYYYPGINQEHAQAQTKEGLVIIQDSGEMGQSCLPFALFNAANTEEDVRVCLGVARKVGDELYAAECIATLGRFECYRGDLVQAAAYFAENMELRKKMGDVEGEGWAYYLLAELAYMSGHPERASEFYSASQSCLKAVENFEFALFISGFPARLAITQGEYRRALEIGERQLAAGQDITSTLVTADALGNLGWAAWAVKADDLVARRCEEVLGADWENCLPCGRGTLFYVFGRMALSRGDFNQARSYLSHFAAIAAPERYLSIQAIGILASVTGQARRAAVIFGALDGFCGWLKHVISPIEQDEYEQALESTRSALGSGEFQVAWREGAAFNQEQAFAYVSEGLDRS